MRVPLLVFAMAVLVTPRAMAQQPTACRILCAPEFNIEPTVTFGKVFGSGRIVGEDGTPTRERRETEFELILSLGLPTSVPWLEFTVEAMFLPFERDSTPELEFETNFIWLPADAHAGGSAPTLTSWTSSARLSARATVARIRTS